MPDRRIPDDLRRFILTSIDSVPHMEALLLFHRNQKHEWSALEAAQKLFISEGQTADLLNRLTEAGFLAVAIDESRHTFRYAPVSEAHRDIVDRLAKLYSKELIAVTQLIHSKAGTKVQQFADAFRLKKE